MNALAWSTLRKRLGGLMPPPAELDSLRQGLYEEYGCDDCITPPEYLDAKLRSYCTEYLHDMEAT